MRYCLLTNSFSIISSNYYGFFPTTALPNGNQPENNHVYAISGFQLQEFREASDAQPGFELQPQNTAGFLNFPISVLCSVSISECR